MQWHTHMHSTIHSINNAEETSQIYGRIGNVDAQSLDFPFDLHYGLLHGPSPRATPVDLP